MCTSTTSLPTLLVVMCFGHFLVMNHYHYYDTLSLWGDIVVFESSREFIMQDVAKHTFAYPRLQYI